MEPQNVWQKTFIEEEEWVKEKRSITKMASLEFRKYLHAGVCVGIQHRLLVKADNLSAAHGMKKHGNTYREVVSGKGNVH